MVTASVKHTPLDGAHRARGARMTSFGGFAMPLQYRGILPEHRAVRHAAGLFDLSHMGEFELRGAGALATLERALTNAAARLKDGQAQYTIMCTADGGTIDDLIVYRLAAEHYLLCVNAANIAADWEQLAMLRANDCDLRDLSEETALIAVQGPLAEEIVAKLTSIPLRDLGKFRLARGAIADRDVLIARTGYTGEDGFEIFAPAHDALRLFDALLEAGTGVGLIPCGLGARDTLRLEAGLPLYGHELDRMTSPLEAGLGSFVKLGRRFAGEPALAAQQAQGPRKRLVGIRTDDGKSIARQGYRLMRRDAPIGAVTSGTFAPTFDRPLAMGYIDAPAGIDPAAANLPIEVEIRGRLVAATIVPLPFYRRKIIQAK